MDMLHDAENIQRRFLDRFIPEYFFQIQLGDHAIAVATNRKDLRDKLAAYFGHVLRPYDGQEPQVYALQTDVEEPPIAEPLTPWGREPGKDRQKEAFADLAGGRLILKVRTGMQFVVSQSRILAVGNCRANLNQVINVVNARYITYRLTKGGVLCHAAAATGNDGSRVTGVGFAGTAGAGKSTLMLHCVGRGASFCSNDRLIVEDTDPVLMQGIPKLPRINPGTALSISELNTILDEERRHELEGWDVQKLWDLEEKYDVDVEAVYGKGRINHTAPLDAFIVLTWSRRNGTSCKIDQLDIDDDPRLLDAICKSAGPFHYDESGQFMTGYVPPERDAYRAILKRVPIFRIDGGVDFDRAATHTLGILGLER